MIVVGANTTWRDALRTIPVFGNAVFRNAVDIFAHCVGVKAVAGNG